MVSLILYCVVSGNANILIFLYECCMKCKFSNSHFPLGFIKHAYNEYISLSRVRSPKQRTNVVHGAHHKSLVGFHFDCLCMEMCRPCRFVCSFILYPQSITYIFHCGSKMSFLQSPSVAVAWHGGNENKRILFAGNKNEGNYTVFLLIPLT